MTTKYHNLAPASTAQKIQRTILPPASAGINADHVAADDESVKGVKARHQAEDLGVLSPGGDDRPLIEHDRHKQDTQPDGSLPLF
jgi:hypothetical protein